MKNIITIPNVISFIRILLIPMFVIVYFSEGIDNKFFWAAFIVIISGLSDIIDGLIARKCNLVSDLGKILDPIADKMTQIVVILCLTINHPSLLPMFGVLFLKELLTLFAAVYVLTNGTKPISARWWGKLSTIVIFLTMIYTVLTDIYSITHIPLYILVAASIVCMIISLSGYFKMFSGQVKGVPKK